MSTIQETALRIADAMGRRLEDANVQWCGQVPRLDDIRHLDEIKQLLRRDETQVAIFDPLYLMLGEAADKTSNVYAQGRVLGNLAQVCLDCNVTPILCVHTKKTGDPHAIPGLADLSGAGLGEFFRWWAMLSRRSVYQPGTGRHELWASFGGSAGHSSLHAIDVDEGVRTATERRYWRVLIQSVDAVRNEGERRREEMKTAAQRDRDAANAQKIMRAMFKAGHPQTKNNIRALCSLKAAETDRAISAMLDSKCIVAVEITKANRKTPYEGFDLSAAEKERLSKLAALESIPKAESTIEPDLGF